MALQQPQQPANSRLRMLDHQPLDRFTVGVHDTHRVVVLRPVDTHRDRSRRHSRLRHTQESSSAAEPSEKSTWWFGASLPDAH